MTAIQPALGLIEGATPLPATGIAASIRDRVILTAAGVESLIFSTLDARFCTLQIAYDGDGAATSGGYPQIIPLWAGTKSAPAIGDDSWYGFTLADATPTDAVLVGTMPSGADWTIAPSWREVKVGGIVLRTFATTTNADKIRGGVKLDVSDKRWVTFVSLEKGDQTNFGYLALQAVLSV